MLHHKRDNHETIQQLPQYHCSMCYRKFFTEEALKEHEKFECKIFYRPSKAIGCLFPNSSKTDNPYQSEILRDDFFWVQMVLG